MLNGKSTLLEFLDFAAQHDLEMEALLIIVLAQSVTNDKGIIEYSRQLAGNDNLKLEWLRGYDSRWELVELIKQYQKTILGLGLDGETPIMLRDDEADTVNYKGTKWFTSSISFWGQRYLHGLQLTPHELSWAAIVVKKDLPSVWVLFACEWKLKLKEHFDSQFKKLTI